MALNCYLTERLQFRWGAGGQTLWEAMEAEKGKRWKTDHWAVWACMGGKRLGAEGDAQPEGWQSSGTGVQLWEVRCVRDELRTEVVDLFDPQRERRVVYDRGLAKIACRFDVMVGVTYPLPNYWRVLGALIKINQIGKFDQEAVFRRLVAHVLEVEDVEAVWKDLEDRRLRDKTLVRHLIEVGDVHDRVIEARWQARLQGASYEYGTASYRGPSRINAELGKRLNTDKQVLCEAVDPEDGWGTEAWTPLAERNLSGLGESIMGTIRHDAGSGEWRVEAMGRERYGAIKAWFEGQAEGKLTYLGEEIQDLGKQVAGELGTDHSDLPAELMVEEDGLEFDSTVLPRGPSGELLPMDQLMLRRLMDWLDEPLPALGNRPPREAVEDPELKELVIRLAKGQINNADGIRLKKGLRIDVSGFVEALGLDELKEPEPPEREILEPESPDDGDEALFPDDYWMGEEGASGDAELEALGRRIMAEAVDYPTMYARRRRSPALTEALSVETCLQRLGRRKDEMETPEDIVDELGSVFGWDIEDLLAEILMTRGMEEPAFENFLHAIGHVTVMMVNRNGKVGKVAPEEVRRRFQEMMDKLIRRMRKNRDPEEIVVLLETGCRQPAVLEVAGIWISMMNRESDEEERIGFDGLVLLRLFVDLVDEALGR